MGFFMLVLATSAWSHSLTKIAFGSCAGARDKVNPQLFKTIDAMEPDAFVWLGDVVYADQMIGVPLFFTPSSPEIWRKKFDDMKDKDGYLQLRTNRRVLGVWDDHDYGINNGNKNFPLKELAREIFLDFFDEAPDSPRRTRQGGIYESYLIQSNDGSGRTVKVVLLDIRYSADKWGPEADCLGEEQWAWLETELKAPGDLTLIGNGIQIMAEDRFGVTEKWPPLSRARLFKLIDGVPNVILLSGDVHMSEIMLNPCHHYPVYEVTSSGITHTVQSHFGFLHLIFTHLLMPYTYNIGHRVTVKNFAMLTVDWSQADPRVTLSIHDTFGETQLSHSFDLSTLSKPASPTAVCAISPVQRYVTHALWSILIYVVPVVLLGVAVRLYNTRKPKPKQS